MIRGILIISALLLGYSLEATFLGRDYFAVFALLVALRAQDNVVRIFLAGILADLVMGTNLGTYAAIYLFGYLAIRYFGRFVKLTHE